MGMEKKMVRVAPPQLGRSLREAEDGLALLGNACRPVTARIASRLSASG